MSARSGGLVNWMDVLAVTAMAAFAAAWHWYRWQGVTPFVLLNSDAANIASFTAAWDHPHLFQNDALLSNPGNFRFYATIHIPVLRALVRVCGDYGSAFLSLLGPHVFVQTLGFYILGRALFKDRYWAFLLAAINLRKIPTGIGADYWGIYVDAIPRFSFQALLPYLIALAYVWRKDPLKWKWLMVLAGLLIYIHPPSAPAIGFALWLGLWAYHPGEWAFARRAAEMLKLGVLFLAVTAPFVILYLSNHAHGSIQQDYHAVFRIMQERFNDIFMDIPYAIANSARRFAESLLLVLAPAGAIALVRTDPGKSRAVRMIGLWAAAILIVSYLIPLTEHLAAKALEMIPVEIDLIRGVRYLYPLGLILCLWPLCEISKRASGGRRAAVMAFGLAGVLGWTLFMRPPWAVDRAADMFPKPRFGPVHPKQEHMMDMLQAVKRFTPEGASILPVGEANPLAVRYFSMRSVAFCVKDGGALSFTNPEALLEWHRNWKTIESYEAMQPGKVKAEGLVNLARSLDADYVLVDFDADGMNLNIAEPVYSNPSYSLLKIIAVH